MGTYNNKSATCTPLEEEKRVFNNWLVKQPRKKDRGKRLELIFDLQKFESDGEQNASIKYSH